MKLNFKKINLSREFIRFLFVGVINTIFGYSLFSLMIYLQMHYSLASLISTIAGIVFNFKTTGNFVFNNKNNRLFIKFVLVYAVIYLLNIFLLSLLKKCGLNDYLSGAILLFPLALVAFILNKFIVYRVKK